MKEMFNIDVVSGVSKYVSFTPGRAMIKQFIFNARYDDILS